MVPRCISFQRIVLFLLTLVLASDQYAFTERELSPLKNNKDVTYQKRNYNTRTPLLLNKYTANGYVIEDEELAYVVTTDEYTKNMYILTLGIKSVPRYSLYPS